MKFFRLFRFDRNKVSIMLYTVVTVLLCYSGIRLLNVSTNIFQYVFNFFSRFYQWIQPGVIGLILAYLLYPLVQMLFRWISKPQFMPDKLAKFLAILMAYVLIVSMIFGFFYAIYISIGGQLSKNTNINQVINFISDFASNRSVEESSLRIMDMFHNSGIKISETIAVKIADLIVLVRDAVYSMIAHLGASLMHLGEQLISLALGVILSIYLIKDADYFSTLGRRLFFIIFGESKIGHRIKLIFSVFDRTFKKYMKGQLLEAFFVAILSIVILWVLGIRYALLIGIVSGVTNMIPYVGPLMGTILAGVMGIIAGSVQDAILGMIAMQVVQQIDNNILAPKIVGGMVGLHPVFTILALIIGGKYGGVIGMVLAVPITASIKILLKIWFERTGKSEDWSLFHRSIAEEEQQIEDDIDREISYNKKDRDRALRSIKNFFQNKQNEEKKRRMRFRRRPHPETFPSDEADTSDETLELSQDNTQHDTAPDDSNVEIR